MSWPRKVFLESTALFQLGNKLEKPEFAKLLERREHLKFDLLVSEVSWAEYIRQRVEKMDELAGSIQSVAVRLGEWDQDSQNINAALASATRKTSTGYWWSICNEGQGDWNSDSRNFRHRCIPSLSDVH
jgi:hypothetical protein